MGAVIDVTKALAELRAQPMSAIERTTAFTWASRALAAEQLHHEAHAAGDAAGAYKWLLARQSYADEAIEHAAFGPPGTTEEVRAALGMTWVEGS